MNFFFIDPSLLFNFVDRMDPNLSDEEFFAKSILCLKRVLDTVNPTHALFCMSDLSRSRRIELYQGYNTSQYRINSRRLTKYSRFKRKLKELGLNSICSSRNESVDIIATMVTKIRSLDANIKITALSADERLYPYLDDNFVMINPFSRSKVTKGPQWCYESFGVYPHLFIDYLSLVGYKSRGIPGAEGMGVKKASRLVNFYGGLDSIYQSIDSVDLSKREILDNNREIISLSRELIKLNDNLSLGISKNDMKYLGYKSMVTN